MAVYEYTAVDEKGHKFSGLYDGIGDISELRIDLAKMGDTLLRAKRRKRETQKRVRVSQDEIVTFTYKLAGMCSAGLSVIRSLETLETQTTNQSFKYVLSDIRRSISTGSTLKDAFGKHKRVFSHFFLGMLEAGETGGRLAETLEASAAYLEKRADFRHKMKSAFAYPLIVGIMCMAVVTALVIFVVPVFSKLYRQMHVPLPGPTQALITLSTLIRDYWWAILLTFAAAALLLRIIWNSLGLKARLDSIRLSIPFFAKLDRTVAISCFVRTFAMLASAGVSLVKAIEVAAVTVNNAKLTEIAGCLQQSIQAGNTFTDFISKCDLFPREIIQLAASGEEAGTLSDMLIKGADFLDKDIDRMLKALLVKIEPSLTVVMGLIVGLILMSVYLPMFDYMSHLK